jgi:hypothetical protein
MLAVFNKRKDSIDSINKVEMLERQINAIYFNMVKKVIKEEGRCSTDTGEGEKLYMEKVFVISKVKELKQKLKDEGLEYDPFY